MENTPMAAGPGAPQPRAWLSNLRRQLFRHRLAYALILPSSVMIAIIYFYPVISGVWQSLHYFNRVQPWAYRFIGLGNYTAALRSRETWFALRASAIWVIGGVSLSYTLGLISALLLNEEFRGRGIYRTLLLLPWVIPPVVASSSWLWMFADHDGIINGILRSLQIIDKPIYWLSKPHLAVIAVVIVYVWRHFPFMMTTLLSALGGIPDDVYEAGRIDGASGWHLFRYITFPLIAPVSIISTVLSSIWAFNDFGTIFVLTGGGPANATMTLIIRSYNEAFVRFNVGYGTTLAVMAMILMLSVGVVYLRLQAKQQDMW